MGQKRLRQKLAISIHALLAESDIQWMCHNTKFLIFLSTLSLRRATQTAYFFLADGIISIHALLAESDERGEHHANSQQEFLSTLSLRRATTANTGATMNA